MSAVDLLLIHPPATYRNPTRLTLHNMQAASVTSTAALELYPLGFLSIGEYLTRHGYHVSLCNLGLLNAIWPQGPPTILLRRLQARLFGIDLHWATHADGVYELITTLKQYHPQTPIVVGGLTATCFWRSLLEQTQADYVMLGDSTEYPLLCLLRALERGKGLAEVPNLAWRDQHGTIQCTGLSWVPDNIDDYRLDYTWILRTAARHLDPVNLLLSLPYRDWLSNPSAAVLTQRGCPHNCLLCGGSAYAYAHRYQRKRPAIKSPAAVLRDVRSIARLMRSPIFLGYDLQDPGQAYYQELFQGYAHLHLPNPLIIEIVQPASQDFFQAACQAARHVTLHISAESHDTAIRMRLGRKYNNRQLETTIAAALEAGVQVVRVFFGIGLPGQTPDSVMDTVAYCGELLAKFGRQGRLFPFIAPFAPFIDPGCHVFDQPARYGYENYRTNLDEYRQAMRQPSWQDSLGYASEQMSRAQLVQVSYQATVALNRLLQSFGLVTASQRQREERRLYREWQAVRRQRPWRSYWLVGESSLYTPGIRGFLLKPWALRPWGIIRTLLSGLQAYWQDYQSHDTRYAWRLF